MQNSSPPAFAHMLSLNFVDMLEKSHSTKRLSQWKSKQEIGIAPETVTIAVGAKFDTICK